jgi:sensor domain CHASE-containing protein
MLLYIFIAAEKEYRKKNEEKSNLNNKLYTDKENNVIFFTNLNGESLYGNDEMLFT